MTQEDLLLPDGYGSPSGSQKRYETFKLKGENDELVIRILPTMKSLLKLDDFGLDWKLHYGWNGRNVKDPTKPQYHPFLCVEEKSYGMTVQACPACVYKAEFQKKLEDAKRDMETKVKDLHERGRTKGKTEAEINKAAIQLKEKLLGEMKPLVDWIYNHGRDGKFRIPCINKQGQFGIFLAPYGVVQGIRKELDALKQRTYPGTDIRIQGAGRKGVWMRVTRTGKASRESDSVTSCRIEKPDGSEVLDFHVITNEQLGQAAERIPDLVELRNQNRISIDLIEALVALDKEGGGSSDPLAVDEIFASKKNEEPEATWAEDPVAELAPKAEKRVEEVKQPEVAPVAVVPKVEPTVEKQEPPKVKEVVEEVKQSEVAPVDDFDALWA